MEDDFDNEMGLPEDELTGTTSDPGDLGLGMDAEDEMDSEAPGRPSGGARAARSASPRKRAAAAPAARKSAGGGAKKKKKRRRKEKGGEEIRQQGVPQTGAQGREESGARRQAESRQEALARACWSLVISR